MLINGNIHPGSRSQSLWNRDKFLMVWCVFPPRFQQIVKAISNFCKREKLRPRALFWLGFFMDGFDSIRWIAVRIFYGIG